VEDDIKGEVVLHRADFFFLFSKKWNRALRSRFPFILKVKSSLGLMTSLFGFFFVFFLFTFSFIYIYIYIYILIIYYLVFFKYLFRVEKQSDILLSFSGDFFASFFRFGQNVLYFFVWFYKFSVLLNDTW